MAPSHHPAGPCSGHAGASPIGPRPARTRDTGSRRSGRALPRWLRRLGAWLRAAAAARQQRRVLDSLSERQLRDIGLRRMAGRYWPLP